MYPNQGRYNHRSLRIIAFSNKNYLGVCSGSLQKTTVSNNKYELLKTCSLMAIFCKNRCSLLVTFYSLLFNIYLLLINFCSLLVTFCSLLVTFCSLIITFSSILFYESIIQIERERESTTKNVLTSVLVASAKIPEHEESISLSSFYGQLLVTRVSLIYLVYEF